MPRQPAPVWKHFELQPCKSKAKCKHCDQQYSCPGGTTSGLLNHIKKEHPGIASQLGDKCDNTKRSSNEQDVHTKPKQARIEKMLVPNRDLLQKKLDEAVVEFLADSGVALRVVDLDSFKKLFKIVNPNIDIKSRKSYTKMIKVKGDELRKEIINIIEVVKTDVKTISFTTDAWTSLSGDQFLSLTIQVIDKNWNLHCFTPYIRPFPQNHTGVNISVCLDEMLEKFGLDNIDWDLFSVNDNASNMKLGIKLSKYLTEYNCDIHTLELALKDSFEGTPGIKNTLKRAKDLARYVTKSPNAQKDIKDECSKEKVHYKKIVNPPVTRWSGSYATFQSILYLKKPLINLMHSDKDAWMEHVLHADDWKLIEGAVDLLGPIRL